jgi:hypothetical protein
VTLQDTGKVAFAERVRLRPREKAPRKLALNLSVCRRRAAIRHLEYRPMHGYFAPEAWLESLQLAGLNGAQVYPHLAILYCWPFSTFACNR